MRWLSVVLLFLSSCAAEPPKSERIDIYIENQTDYTLKFKPRAGIFSRVITLKPGHSWSGYFPIRFIPSKITVKVVEKKKKKKK